MKIWYTSLLATLLTISTLTATADDQLKTPREQISYVFGVQVARNMQQQGLNLDEKAFSQAISDVWGNKKPTLGGFWESGLHAEQYAA